MEIFFLIIKLKCLAFDRSNFAYTNLMVDRAVKSFPLIFFAYFFRFLPSFGLYLASILTSCQSDSQLLIYWFTISFGCNAHCVGMRQVETTKVFCNRHVNRALSDFFAFFLLKVLSHFQVKVWLIFLSLFSKVFLFIDEVLQLFKKLGL